MTALPWSYWEALRQASEGLNLMKFTLVYDGDLPAGDGKRAVYASRIRNELHDQMADLWDSHIILRQLARTARVPESGHSMMAVSGMRLSEYTEPIGEVPHGFVDLCAPIRNYIPIVRNSLHLACAIDMLFLRHEEPKHLFEAGGDLDNRIKCFFDGLQIPNVQAEANGEEPTAVPLYCLLENDRLISDFSVRTGRLLGRGEKKRHAVRIQADITVKVLRVTPQNQILMGG